MPQVRNQAPSPAITPSRDDVPDGWKETFDTFLRKAKDIHPDAGIKAVREYFGRLLVIPDLSKVPNHLHDEIATLALRAWQHSWDHCIDCGKQPDLESRGGWNIPLCTECASLRHPEKHSPITPRQSHKSPNALKNL